MLCYFGNPVRQIRISFFPRVHPNIYFEFTVSWGPGEVLGHGIYMARIRNKRLREYSGAISLGMTSLRQNLPYLSVGRH